VLCVPDWKHFSQYRFAALSDEGRAVLVTRAHNDLFGDGIQRLILRLAGTFGALCGLLLNRVQLRTGFSKLKV